MKTKRYVVARDAEQAQHRAETGGWTFATKAEATKEAKEANRYELDRHRNPYQVFLARTVVETV